MLLKVGLQDFTDLANKMTCTWLMTLYWLG